MSDHASTDQPWTEEHVRNYPRAAAGEINRLRAALESSVAAKDAKPVAHLHSNGDVCVERMPVRPKEWPVQLYDHPPVPQQQGWQTVEHSGMPPCDGEAVYVGINTAGFACCFNYVTIDGVCSMQGPEICTVQMSGLSSWRLLDRPDQQAKDAAA